MTTNEAGDTSHSQAIPLAAFQDLVVQYHHRLLSLEADLKDHARAQALSPRAFTKRVKQLKDVQKSLNALQRLCLAEVPGQSAATDIGLPVLDDCTPAERAVCEDFLGERRDAISVMEEETARVYKWLVETVSGRTGPFRLTFRLSKLRRLIQRSERETQSIQDASKGMALQIDKLLQSRKGGGREHGASTLDGLMTLFTQLDGTIGRVAQLRALVRKEQVKTNSMDAWLKQEEGKIRARPSMLAPPTPLTLSRAEAEALGPQPTYRRNVRRRRVAEEFWQDVVHNGARAPTEKEIRQAAAVFKMIRPKETT